MATKASFHWPVLMLMGGGGGPSALFVSSHLGSSLSAWSSETVNEAAGQSPAQGLFSRTDSCWQSFTSQIQENQSLMPPVHSQIHHSQIHTFTHTLCKALIDMKTGGAGIEPTLWLMDNPLCLYLNSCYTKYRDVCTVWSVCSEISWACDSEQEISPNWWDTFLALLLGPERCFIFIFNLLT